MLLIGVNCLFVHDFTVMTYCMLLHLVGSCSESNTTGSSWRKTTEGMSGLISSSVIYLHCIEEAKEKTNEYFFGGVKQTDLNFLPRWDHKLGQKPSVGSA